MRTRYIFIECANYFLENAESIDRKGYNLFKKEHSVFLSGGEPYKAGVLNFLNFCGSGFRKRSRKKEKIETLAPLDEISKKNKTLISDFIHDLNENYDYSPCTIRSYRDGLVSFFKYSNEFSNDLCKRYIRTLEEKGFSPQTICLRILSLNRFSEFIKKPINLKRPKIQKSLQTENVISENEYNKLIEYLSNLEDKRYYFYIKILATTGARVSEFLQMKWEDVLDGQVTLKCKGNKYRRIFFSKQVQKEVKDYLKETGKTGLIATGKYGPISSRGISSYMRELSKKVGIPKEKMHPHGFRHFFAKMYLKKNKDVVQLAEILGHSSIDITRVYLQKTYEEQKRDFNKNVVW